MERISFFTPKMSLQRRSKMSDINVGKLKELVRDVSLLRQECDALAAQKSEKEKARKRLQEQLREYLNEYGLEKFDAGDAGLVRAADKDSVSVTDKTELISWLKQRDLFDEVISLSNPALVRLAKSAEEAAMIAGQMAHGIPGLSEVRVYETVNTPGYKKVSKGD